MALSSRFCPKNRSMKSNISVIIPLYNKERTIARAIRSAAEQTLLPDEIIIVDDGSTDRSAEAAERCADECQRCAIRILHQPNGGVSAARNRAIAEARSEYVALLDADDRWTADHLAACRSLIGKYPGCGIWATSFRIDDGTTLTDGDTPDSEGIVDFFTESLRRYTVIPSAAVLHRGTAIAAGGFPEGMRMGEDQYLWTKMARMAPVAFTPVRSVIYSKVAENRSSAIWRREECRESFEELIAGAASDDEREYIARVALGKALVQSAKGATEEAARAIAHFGFTRLNRRALRKLRFVNRLPVRWRQPFLDLYNFAAWKLARKGL